MSRKRKKARRGRAGKTGQQAQPGPIPGRSPAGLVPADYLWGLLLISVIGFLVLRSFVWGGGAFPQLPLGPLQLSSFGVLAALNVLFGVYLIQRWCTRFGLDWPKLREGMIWIIGLGYLISHLVAVALYSPDQLTSLAALLDLRTGLSSFGGMFGGALVAVLFLRRHRLPVWRFADPLVYGFVGGYVFGRAGCFTVHDHPGRASDFVLAVDIDGIRRHDLGFYEMWLMLGLLLVITLVARRRRPPDGTVLALAATLYAPIRFGLDSLRIADPVYAGLTPGQWLAIPLFAVGVWGCVRLVSRRRLEDGEARRDRD